MTALCTNQACCHLSPWTFYGTVHSCHFKAHYMFDVRSLLKCYSVLYGNTTHWVERYLFFLFFYWEMSYALLSCVILKYLHGHGNIKSKVALVYREAQWNFSSLYKSCQETSWTELMRMRDEKKAQEERRAESPSGALVKKLSQSEACGASLSSPGFFFCFPPLPR